MLHGGFEFDCNGENEVGRLRSVFLLRGFQFENSEIAELGIKFFLVRRKFLKFKLAYCTFTI